MRKTILASLIDQNPYEFGLLVISNTFDKHAYQTPDKTSKFFGIYQKNSNSTN